MTSVHPPLPDLSAFDAESSIEKKRRAGNRTTATGSAHSASLSSWAPPHPSFQHAFPLAGQAVPAMPQPLSLNTALMHTHAHVPAIPHVPAFLSSSQGRPVCPSTPMKSPAMAKLFHTHGYTTAAGAAGAPGAVPSGGMTMGPMLQHATPMGSPGSARKKTRSGTQGATPQSRGSSGSATPRAGSQKRKERSSSADLLASLSKPAGSGATSPERRMLHGLTPLSTSHSSSDGGADSLQDASCSFSVCSSQGHSPRQHSIEAFLLNSSANNGTAHSSRDHSGASSLASSLNSSMSGFSRLQPGFGLMGSLQSLHMSGGPHSSHHSGSRRSSGSSSVSSAPPQPSHFSNTFFNLGCIGRGSFGVCYHVLQTAAAGAGVVGQEFAVKKSIRPFKGENDRNQKLKEVDNWRLLMSSSQQQSALLPSSRPHVIDPSTDHVHLVRYYDAWEESGYLYIQSELFRSGTVRNFLDEVLDGPADEDLIWLFLLDLARGLRFIHQQAQLIHLDLKWDNTFIATDNSDERGLLKIGDFGLSMNAQGKQQVEGTQAQMQQQSSQPALHESAFPSSDPCAFGAGASSSSLSLLCPSSVPDISEGDQTYLAPEFMDSSLLASCGGSISTAADMFSLGVMLFEVAFDVQLPKRGQSWIDLRNENIDWTGRRYQGGGNDANGTGATASFLPRSSALVSLISRLLRRDPAARPSIEEVLSDPTLASFARGERGTQQRQRLRSIPTQLKPLGPQRVEQLIREHQAAQALHSTGHSAMAAQVCAPSAAASSTPLSSSSLFPSSLSASASAASPFFSPPSSCASSVLQPTVHDLDADLMSVTVSHAPHTRSIAHSAQLQPHLHTSLSSSRSRATAARVAAASANAAAAAAAANPPPAAAVSGLPSSWLMAGGAVSLPLPLPLSLSGLPFDSAVSPVPPVGLAASMRAPAFAASARQDNAAAAAASSSTLSGFALRLRRDGAEAPPTAASASISQLTPMDDDSFAGDTDTDAEDCASLAPKNLFDSFQSAGDDGDA